MHSHELNAQALIRHKNSKNSQTVKISSA